MYDNNDENTNDLLKEPEGYLENIEINASIQAFNTSNNNDENTNDPKKEIEGYLEIIEINETTINYEEFALEALKKKHMHIVFVVDYTKIINMMKNTTLMNNKMKDDNLIRLVLCYSTIEDLLALSEALNLGDKLKVKYLNIDLEFQRLEGNISTGIEVLASSEALNLGDKLKANI